MWRHDLRSLYHLRLNHDIVHSLKNMSVHSIAVLSHISLDFPVLEEKTWLYTQVLMPWMWALFTHDVRLFVWACCFETFCDASALVYVSAWRGWRHDVCACTWADWLVCVISEWMLAHYLNEELCLVQTLRNDQERHEDERLWSQYDQTWVKIHLWAQVHQNANCMNF